MAAPIRQALEIKAALNVGDAIQVGKLVYRVVEIGGMIFFQPIAEAALAVPTPVEQTAKLPDGSEV